MNSQISDRIWKNPDSNFLVSSIKCDIFKSCKKNFRWDHLKHFLKYFNILLVLLKLHYYTVHRLPYISYTAISHQDVSEIHLFCFDFISCATDNLARPICIPPSHCAEQFLQGNVPLRHLLAQKRIFVFITLFI